MGQTDWLDGYSDKKERLGGCVATGLKMNEKQIFM